MKCLLVVVCMVFVCMACSDDSGKDPGYAEKMAGIYTGYSAATFLYSADPVYTVEQQVTVTSVSGETADISYVDDTWGTYQLKGGVIPLL